MTKVKICGLRRVEDIIAVNQYCPDYAGCILAEGFSRTVDQTTAKMLRETLHKTIPLVGVFVNDTVDTVTKYLEEGIIDIAQLHGQESDRFIMEIKKRTEKPVWKVFQMKGLVDYEQIEQCPADMVLLDAGTGSGETFDWSLVQHVKRPFMLAGGLTAQNLQQAIVQNNPYGVDTSSGVETLGYKDAGKIAAFIETARRDNK